MLKIAGDELDYVSIRQQIMSLKASASYICAKRVQYLSEKIQLSIENELLNEILKYYPILIKECIILKRIINRELYREKG